MNLLNRPLRKACAANATSGGFTAKTAAATARPSGNLVLELAPAGGHAVPAHLLVMPYGLGADNDVFSLRLWGWRRYAATPNGQEFYLPAMLGEFACTLSGFVGVAGYPVLATERFCDTITLVAAVGEATVTADVTRTGTVELYSPANNTPAWVLVPTRGVELLEFDFGQTIGTPTCNALVTLLGCP